jgi:hypothetical protein
VPPVFEIKEQNNSPSKKVKRKYKLITPNFQASN